MKKYFINNEEVTKLAFDTAINDTAVEIDEGVCITDEDIDLNEVIDDTVAKFNKLLNTIGFIIIGGLKLSVEDK